MGKETGTADLEAIEEKIDKGEALTPEEEKVIEAPGSEVDSGDVDPETETVALKKDEPKDKEELPTEDTPSEKDAEAAKAKEQEAADAALQEAERKKLIEEEAEKPLDEADIKDYSPTERALFFELRKERRKRQDSQRDADTLRFQRAKEEAAEKLEREQEAARAKAEAEAEIDPFEGMEDDDLLTAGQIKKILAGKGKKQESTPAANLEGERLSKLQSRVWVLEAQSKAPDALLICEIGEQVVDLLGDKIAEAEVSDVVAKGGNPVIATVNYLRAHPKWPEIEAKIAERSKAASGTPEAKAKEAEARTNKERAERIEANKRKPTTTGSGGGAPASGEYTIQELLEMPDEKFAQLPKSQRDRILETF